MACSTPGTAGLTQQSAAAAPVPTLSRAQCIGPQRTDAVIPAASWQARSQTAETAVQVVTGTQRGSSAWWLSTWLRRSQRVGRPYELANH